MITVVEADQCMYGLKRRGGDNKSQVAAKKPTKFMTNSRALGHELSRRCNGKHQHQSLVDGRAREAAGYPPELCKAICRGIVKIRREKHEAVRVVATIDAETRRRTRDPEEFHERDEADIHMQHLYRVKCERLKTHVSRHRERKHHDSLSVGRPYRNETRRWQGY